METSKYIYYYHCDNDCTKIIKTKLEIVKDTPKQLIYKNKNGYEHKVNKSILDVPTFRFGAEMYSLSSDKEDFFRREYLRYWQNLEIKKREEIANITRRIEKLANMFIDA